MNLLTKALILLIVTNSLASSVQNKVRHKSTNLRSGLSDLVKCNASVAAEGIQNMNCLNKKWGLPEIAVPNLPIGIRVDSNNNPDKIMCCYGLDLLCVTSTFDKKNCEVKDGYDEELQKDREIATKKCTDSGVNPDTDCASLIQSVPKECHELDCNWNEKPLNEKPLKEKPTNVKPDNMAQGLHKSLCLIVISFVAKFILF